MAEVGTAWISIVPEVNKITPSIARAVGAAEPAVAKQGESMGSKLGQRLQGALKKTAVGAGVAAGGAIAAGLTKGIGRLNAIEQAQSKLRALGNSGSDVEQIMDNALASVKGTAFGIGEAAGTAATMVASGIKPGKELESVLKGVADSAAVAGTDLNEMGLIWGKAAAKGKVDGDIINSMLERQIPIYDILSQKMGKNSEEIAGMVSKGKVSFQEFSEAMQDYVGGGALEMGNTVQGAFANMGAALGRLGATIVGPFFNNASDAFNGVGSALDAMNDRVQPVMESFSGWLESQAVPALKRFADEAKTSWSVLANSGAVQSAIRGTADAFASLFEAGKQIAPAVMDIGSALGQATAALGISTWSAFVSVLDMAGTVAQALAGPLQTVAGVMRDHPGLVTAAVGAWVLFKKVPGWISPISSRMGAVAASAVGMKEQVSKVGTTFKQLQWWSDTTGQGMSRMQIAMQATADAGSGMAQKLAAGYNRASAGLYAFAARHQEAAATAQSASLQQANAFSTVDRMASSMAHSTASSMGRFAAAVAGTGGAALTGLKAAFTSVKAAGANLMSALGGPWAIGLTAAAALFMNQKAAAESAKAAHEAVTAAVHDGAAAQAELRAQLAGTTGELGEQGVAAAARVAKGELAELVEMGSRKFSWKENLDQLTVSMDSVINKIPGMASEAGKAHTQATIAAKEQRQAYKALESAAQEVGIPMDALNDTVAKGGPEFDRLVSTLRNSGDAGNAAADQLMSARDKIQTFSQAAQSVDKGFAQAAQAVNKLADASSSAEDKLAALDDWMVTLGLRPKNAEKAMMDAAKAVDGLADSAIHAKDASAGLGDAMFDVDGKLQPTNANAQALTGALDTMYDSLKKAAINGADVNEAFSLMQPELKKLQEAFGLTDAQMQKLVESYGLVPDQIETAMKLQGADEVTQDLASVAAHLSGAPDAKSIEVSLESDEASEKLKGMGFELEKLDNGNTKIKVDDAEARQKLEALLHEQFPQIDAANPTAKANLDDSGLLFKAEYAKYQLQALDLARPTPLASMDISQLSSEQQQALQKVGLLNGQKPTPKASMNIDQLSQEQQLALAKVFDLGAKRPTPVGNLDKKPLMSEATAASSRLSQLDKQQTNPKIQADASTVPGVVDGVKRMLAGIKDKVVNIVTRRSGDSGNFEGGVAGLYAGGRALPAYAGGGKLPVAGPGTGTRDGILGVGDDGMPVARVNAGEWVINRRSSSKYHDLLAAINRDEPSLKQVANLLPGYDKGGKVTASQLDKFARGLEGKPYVWGGVNWGDCSGAMSAIANYAVGRAPFASRFATGNQRSELLARGFKLGRGSRGDLRMGWFNGGPWGGHTSGTLPNGVNVEMGGGRGNGQYGGAAAGANHSQYTDHAFLPMRDLELSVEDRDGYYDFGPKVDTAGWSPTGSGSGSSVSASDFSSSTSTTGPRSISEAAGMTAAAFASGQVADILSVLGLPDGVPAMEAADQARGLLDDYNEEYNARVRSEKQLRQELDEKRKELNKERSAPPKEGESAQDKAKRIESLEKDVAKLQGEVTRTEGMKKSAIGGILRDARIDPGVLADPVKRGQVMNAVSDALLAATGSPKMPERLTPGVRKAVTTALAGVKGFANGGRVTGPGGPKDDKILAWLSNDEFVVNAAAAREHGGLLEALNSGVLGKLPDMPRIPQAVSAPPTITFEPPAGVGGGNSYTFIAENRAEMMRTYRREMAKGRAGRIGAR